YKYLLIFFIYSNKMVCGIKKSSTCHNKSKNALPNKPGKATSLHTFLSFRVYPYHEIFPVFRQKKRGESLYD
ncbi:hypothetical protein, partial [Prolixibacter bellariivorans]|uniref:hypothetical protein n=1 Tax=Prolixibacter bellariivorans TaxID=314319 RepID=UPI001F258BA2